MNARVRLAIYGLIVSAMVGLVIYWWPVLCKLWIEHPASFVTAILAMGVGTLVQAHNFRAFLPRHRRGIKTLELLRIWAIGSLANYVGPFQPGIALRVVFLRKRGVIPSESLVASWRQLCVSAWISLFGFAVGLFLVDARRNAELAAISMLFFVAIYFLREVMFKRLNRIKKPDWLVSHRELLKGVVGEFSWRGCVGVIFQYLLGSALIFCIYRQFGANIGLGQAVLIASAVYVSSLVSLLPGNLGVLDGIYLLGGHGLGLTIQQSAAIALLLRVAHIGSCFLIALLIPSREEETKYET